MFAISIFAFFVFLTSLIVYYLLFSSNFKVKKIEINGLDAISENEVRIKLTEIFKSDKSPLQNYANYFMFPSEQLSAALRDEFPEIADLIIDKVYPSILRLTIIKRTREGIWCSRKDETAQSECFYLDKEGVIFAIAPRSYGATVFLIMDERNTDYGLGKKVLDKNDVIKFKNFLTIVSGNFHFFLREFLIKDNGNLEIITSEYWKIFPSESMDITRQFSNLKYVLDEKIKEKRGNLEYVDLRLGNRIYYRMKN